MCESKYYKQAKEEGISIGKKENNLKLKLFIINFFIFKNFSKTLDFISIY